MQQNWGVVDWGKVYKNVSMFTGGCFTKCGSGKGDDTVGYSTLIGGIWSSDSQTWTGFFQKNHLDGTKWFNENWSISHGAFSFATAIKMQLGSWSMSNMKKYDAIL